MVCSLNRCGSINPINPAMVQKHEALHSIGDPPRKGFVCPSCDSLHDTAEAAWACAATHGIEHDNKRCLWAGCGKTFPLPSKYKAHEATHTGIWPFTCPTCGEGQNGKAAAERHCVIGAGCVCGKVYYANEGKSALLAPPPLPHSVSQTTLATHTLHSHASHPCSLAGKNEKDLASHLKRCRASGGPATKDTLAVGQVKRRKPNEAECVPFKGQAASGGA